MAAPCHLIRGPRCPGDSTPAARGQPLAKSGVSQGSVSRPAFVQLMQAGPSLSPADVEGWVTGRGRAWGPWSLQRGTSLDSRVCRQQSLVLVNGRVSHSETTGENIEKTKQYEKPNCRLKCLPFMEKKGVFLIKYVVMKKSLGW